MVYELAGGTGAAEASLNKDEESPGMAAAAMRALRREPSIGRGQVYGSEDTPDHVDAGIEVEFLGPDESQPGTSPSSGQRHNSKLAEWGNGQANVSAKSVLDVKPGDVAGAGENAHNELPLRLLHKEEDLSAASTDAQLPDEMLESDVEAVTQLPSLEDSGVSAAQVGTATEDAAWRSRLGTWLRTPLHVWGYIVLHLILPMKQTGKLVSVHCHPVIHRHRYTVICLRCKHQRQRMSW